MTEDTTDTDRTLGEMSHTNPYTNEAFGDTQTYNRGQFVAADGGERNAGSRPSSEVSSDGGEAGGAVHDDTDEETTTDEPSVDEGQTMRDVDHTPPRNAPSASAAYMDEVTNENE